MTTLCHLVFLPTWNVAFLLKIEIEYNPLAKKIDQSTERTHELSLLKKRHDLVHLLQLTSQSYGAQNQVDAIDLIRKK
jgi:hypothetical protein